MWKGEICTSRIALTPNDLGFVVKKQLFPQASNLDLFWFSDQSWDKLLLQICAAVY